MNLEDRAPRSVRINCGNLDMRETTEQVASRILHVNTGNVLVTAETRDFLSMFSNNVGNLIEVPKEVRLKTVLSGEIMGRDAFMGEVEPFLIMNMSDITLEPDVTAEGVEGSWYEIINMGNILYPEHVAGPITNKLTSNMGTLTPYKSSAQLIKGDVMLDEVYLASLDDDADLVVTGNLRIPEPVPNDTLDRKINTVLVRGDVLCRAENVSMLRSKFDPKFGSPETNVVPDEHELVERDLSLTAGTIRSWKKRKIFATGNVTMHEDIDTDTLERALDRLVCTGRVLCPEPLSEVFSSVCDTLNTDVIFYGGALWVVETDLTLRQSRLDLIDGTATLYNSGNVNIEEDVDARILYDRLAAVYNWGTITCFPDQMSSVEARVAVNEGTLHEASEQEERDEEDQGEQGDYEEHDDGTITINAGNYKL